MHMIGHDADLTWLNSTLSNLTALNKRLPGLTSLGLISKDG